MSTLGEQIRELREQAGVTQAELGAAVGVQKSAVSKWEVGRADPPLSKLDAIGAALGVRISVVIQLDRSAAPDLSALGERQRATLDEVLRALPIISDQEADAVRTMAVALVASHAEVPADRG